jgi:Squalene-hopene cyclase C-terminal domain
MTTRATDPVFSHLITAGATSSNPLAIPCDYNTSMRISCGAVLLLALSAPAAAQETSEDRAAAYLAREVPRWSNEHGCYSCHNNGDGARALFAALRHSIKIPAASTDSTIRWLRTPRRWDDNKGEPGFSDKALARIQFAAALRGAAQAGSLNDTEPLVEAARLVTEFQKSDGSWQIDQGSIGSPVTYGTALATAMARLSLAAAGDDAAATAIAAADRWLRKTSVATVTEAAAVLLGLEGSADAPAREQSRRCLEILSQGQNPDGGWGPYLKSASEPFDTAIALLAVASFETATGWVRRGRAYLASTQLADGSWPETTRPPRAESYAQRISTTAWALEALLATRSPQDARPPKSRDKR